jgi:hypothetical protein
MKRVGKIHIRQPTSGLRVEKQNKKKQTNQPTKQTNKQKQNKQKNKQKKNKNYLQLTRDPKV